MLDPVLLRVQEPLLWVLLGLGGLTCTATWFILRRQAALTAQAAQGQDTP